MLECLENLGERVIRKETRSAIQRSGYTGQDLSDFFKTAYASQRDQLRIFVDQIDPKGDLKIEQEQFEQIWQWLNEVMIAAADSENTDEAAATEELQLSIKVQRWMHVKEPSLGAKQYIAYELQVTAPFDLDGGERQMETRTYLQRWSEMFSFNQKFKAWAKGTAKIDGTRHMFEQTISSKKTYTDDPKRLESRKMELNDYVSKLSHWANEAADKRLINMGTLIDDVIEPCFGADPGGRSPTGKRTSQNVQESDQVYSGWLNLVRKKGMEPFHVVLARAPIEVKGKDSRREGCRKGTFGLYHGPKEQHAESAIPLPGKLIGGCAEVGASSGDRSPASMRGLHQFSLQWHQYVQDRRGDSTFALQTHVFNTSDEDLVEAWVRSCRKQQRKHFGDWDAKELGMWMQATGAFGEDEPLLDCGIDARDVEELVRNGDERELKKALRRVQRDNFSDLWTKLRELLVDDLGADLADPEAEPEHSIFIRKTTVENKESADAYILYEVTTILCDRPEGPGHVTHKRFSEFDQLDKLVRSSFSAKLNKSKEFVMPTKPKKTLMKRFDEASVQKRRLELSSTCRSSSGYPPSGATLTCCVS